MPKYIELGYPLDLLFNRDCKFKNYEKNINKIDFEKITNEINLGGLVLPEENFTGSGNIIIRGKPGTAKSTLAMQLAVAAGFNNLYSFYITLEESPDNTLKKVESFGWESTCKVLNELCNNKVNQTYIENLIANCQNDNKVIISSLSPRNVFKETNNDDTLFHDRYKQLERILIETSIYNKKNKITGNRVGIICIDSINVFGDSLLNRTEIFRLFELFKQYEVLGIFIVEEDEKFLFSTDNKLNSETIEYVADIVISLTTGEDDGYSMRYFEITKSRYQHQVYGKHPFKISEIIKPFQKKFPRRAIRVFPSLHYLVYGTDTPDSTDTNDNPGNQENNVNINYKRKDFFFDPSVALYLPNESFSTILIEGARATFKSTLARDFLLKGLFKDRDDTNDNSNYSHVLIIRFHDRPSSKNNTFLQQFLISEACRKYFTDELKLGNNVLWENFKIDEEISEKENTKRFLNSYIYEKNNRRYRFTELVFKSGYVFPEELIQIFLETLKQFESPTRVVIDEIGRIGSSYPLLFKSKTAGELFITALVHIIRNYKIKLLITGTTGEYDRSDHVINITRTVVDTIVLTDNINVFGDNYVIIKGEGLRSSESQIDIENVPGVIQPLKNGFFKIEKDKFYGLVGFDTDNIYRPEIDLYLFRENALHLKYSTELIKLLKYAFSYGGDAIFTSKDLEITTHTIYDSTSTAFHDSLGLLRGRPIKKTVICTIDEYSINEDLEDIMVPVNKELIRECKINKPSKLDKYSLPYYDNVLVIVYNSEYNTYKKECDKLTNDERNEINNWKFNSWEDLYNKISELDSSNPQKIEIDFKSNVDETLSCLLLDTIFASIEESQLSYKEDEIQLDKLIRKLLKKVNGSDILLKNMFALSKIIRKSKKSKMWRGGEINEDVNTVKFKNEIKEEKLLPGSIFYICWYSELRELIECYPRLASQLYVYRLPGGGFTGDWRISVMKGSVSVNLGYDVLRILCGEEEDYKRFIMGVGLPTNGRFYKGKNLKKNVDSKFLAWPNSKLLFDKQNQSLDEKILFDINKDLENTKGRKIIYDDIPQIFKLYYIHEKANKRSKIKNYKAIRPSLVILFKQLIRLESEVEIKTIIIDRMKNIIKRFNVNRKPHFNQ
jgi:KaiC/GvpD/RAD55 family RecA-like ATPase